MTLLLVSSLFCFTLVTTADRLREPACLVSPSNQPAYPLSSYGYLAGQNPAGLADPSRPTTLVFLAPRADGSSSGSTLSDYQAYLMRPVHLSERDKEIILDHIGEGPLRLNAMLNTHLLSGLFRQFGWSLQSMALIAQSLPRDLFELALYGNQPNRLYDLSGLSSDTLALIRLTGATGFQVLPNLRLGLGISWLHGLRYVHTDTCSGQVVTTPHTIVGEVRQVRTEAKGGEGLALELGAAASLGSDWHLGLYLRDLPGAIWWSTSPRKRAVTFRVDSLSLERYRLRPSLDSFLVTLDSSSPTSRPFTNLPALVAIGLGRQLTPRLGLSLGLNLPVSQGQPFQELPLLSVQGTYQLSHPFSAALELAWHRVQGAIIGLSLGLRTNSLGFQASAFLGGRSLSHIRSGGLGFSIGQVR